MPVGFGRPNRRGGGLNFNGYTKRYLKFIEKRAKEWREKGEGPEEEEERKNWFVTEANYPLGRKNTAL